MNLLSWLAPLVVLAQPPAPPQPTMLLWADKAPHAVGDSETDKPKMTMYAVPAAKATGAAVVICPGGGYGHLAIDHEGKQVAEFFNELGVTAFVLQYRIATKERPGPLAPAPMLDVQRAIRTVRHLAAEKQYGLQPNKIGLIGFSAGGHLASTGGTHFDEGDKNAKDPVDRVSCRPDFLMLGYPVISMDDDTTHGGSKRNLLGAKPDAKLVELYCNEKQVTEKTPPTFIFHTTEDTAVKVENAIKFYMALRKAKVPVEMHVYEKGKHGVGINPKTGVKSTDNWKERLADWLLARGIVEKK